MKRSDARKIKVSGEDRSIGRSSVSEDSVGADTGKETEKVNDSTQIENEEFASSESQNTETQGQGSEGQESQEQGSEAQEKGSEDRQKASASDENYDKYLRALADLENVKKRHAKERSDLIRYAGEHLARDLVEVLDNLELALKQKGPAVNDELLKGVDMIYKQFVSALEKHAVSSESAIGKPFDPQKHQAMTSVPSTEFEPGMVMEEYRKAYFFKDRLLRPGQVVVAASPDTVSSKKETPEGGEVQSSNDGDDGLGKELGEEMG